MWRRWKFRRGFSEFSFFLSFFESGKFTIGNLRIFHGVFSILRKLLKFHELSPIFSEFSQISSQIFQQNSKFPQFSLKIKISYNFPKNFSQISTQFSIFASKFPNSIKFIAKTCCAKIYIILKNCFISHIYLLLFFCENFPRFFQGFSYCIFLISRNMKWKKRLESRLRGKDNEFQ